MQSAPTEKNPLISERKKRRSKKDVRQKVKKNSFASFRGGTKIEKRNEDVSISAKPHGRQKILSQMTLTSNERRFVFKASLE